MRERAAGVSKDFRLIFRGLRLVRSMMPSYLVLMLLTALVTAVSPYTSLYFSAKIIDEIMGGRDIQRLIFYVVALVVSDFGLRLLYQMLFASVRVNELVFPSWEELCLNQKSFKLDYSYMENPKIRELRQKIIDNREMGGLQVLLQRVLWLFRSVLSMLVALAMLPKMFASPSLPADGALLGWINTPAAAAVFVAGLAVLLAAVVRINREAETKQYEYSNELSKTQKLSHFYMDEYFDDSKTGKDIRLFEQDGLILASLQNAFSSHLTQYKRTIAQRFGRTEKEGVISSLLSGMVYIFVGLKTLSGALTAGNLVKYSGVIRNLMYSILGITGIVGTLRRNNRYLEDLYEYLDFDESASGARGGAAADLTARYTFEFDNVSFRYPETDSFALKNINVKINAGERLAIVGRNGSGKTTFVKLLCGLYDPSEGSLRANGIDKRGYEYSEYLKLFSIVFQDFKLFSFSLGQNVGAGERYDEARVWAALERAGMGRRAGELARGLDTPLYKDFDEDGVEISGGEAQKIAIARAFYKDAPVPVFDEPTAELDPAAEFEIYSRLSETTDEKTTVFISHRLSSCRFCDRIIVFDNGEIVQDGSHEKLLDEKGGLYYRLWNAQAQYYKSSGIVV